MKEPTNRSHPIWHPWGFLLVFFWKNRTTHCNILQHSATHCNTLQQTAAHCTTLQRVPANAGWWRPRAAEISEILADAVRKLHTPNRLCARICTVFARKKVRENKKKHSQRKGLVKWLTGVQPPSRKKTPFFFFEKKQGGKSGKV